MGQRVQFSMIKKLDELTALLHQHQREVRTLERAGMEPLEYIEATLDDIAAANTLAHAVLGTTLDELPPQTRRLLHLLRRNVSARAESEGLSPRDTPLCACPASADQLPASNSSSMPSPACPKLSRSSFPGCSTTCWGRTPAWAHKDRRPPPPDPLSAAHRRRRQHGTPSGTAHRRSPWRSLMRLYQRIRTSAPPKAARPTASYIVIQASP